MQCIYKLQYDNGQKQDIEEDNVKMPENGFKQVS